MSMDKNFQFHHLPVLYREVVEHLTFDPDRRMRLIDGTIGGGGHSSLLLERYPKLELLGMTAMIWRWRRQRKNLNSLLTG